MLNLKKYTVPLAILWQDKWHEPLKIFLAKQQFSAITNSEGLTRLVIFWSSAGDQYEIELESQNREHDVHTRTIC